MSSNFLVDATSNRASELTNNFLYKKLKPIIYQKRPIIIVSIGSDRATGDCLGPLVGSYLKFSNSYNVYKFGSLEKPVHSRNLEKTLFEIENTFINPFIIAIDASLGDLDNIGKVFIEDSPLQPGLALNKDLPPVGELSITGIVNISGNYEFMVIQNTRLYTVMMLSKFIANCLSETISLLNTELSEEKCSS